MSHLVQYHNTKKMGALQIDSHKFDAWTNRRMRDIDGATVWMIVGEGQGPREYRLAYRFMVDGIGDAPPNSGKKYTLFGHDGVLFEPRIRLDTRPWWRTFLKSQQNFRWGLRPIEPEFIHELEALTSLKSVTPEQVLYGIERFDAECRETARWRDWHTKRAQKYALDYEGRWYPPKMVLSLGTDIPRGRFSGGIETSQANGVLERLGFRITPIPPAQHERLRPEESDQDAATLEPFVADGRDTREFADRTIRMRRGQQAFRSALRQRYGDICLISGCELLDVLEAAHIKPYRGKTDGHLENGLLLRADLHTLFDLNLIGVEPDTLTVRVHPRARVAGYEQFDGQDLRCTDKSKPSKSALMLRWKLFMAQGGQS